MRFINLLLLLCQAVFVTMVFPLWSMELPQQSQDPNCSAPAGHPESLTFGGQAYHYQYDEKGRVLSRAGEYTEYRMEYVWQHDYP